MLKRLWQINLRYYFRRRITLEAFEQIQSGLLEESLLDWNYVILIIGSCVIATFGLLSNSAAVIIGAMLIAPLMMPIRALAFAGLEGNATLFRQALAAIATGTFVSVAIAWLLGSMVALPQYGSEVLARSRPTLLDLGIAVAAGGISGFAKVQPKVSATLAGTAIAVALMPPVCVIGLGLSRADWPLSWGATLLYLTNLLGITLSCMVTFLLAGYIPLARAKRALMTTAAMTGLLLIPLGISFFELIRQVQLENSLKRALLNRTITFQRIQLVDTETNWLTNPPEVRLLVRTQETLSSKQVSLLEAFVQQEMGRPFTLIFEISEVREIRGMDAESPEKTPDESP